MKIDRLLGIITILLQCNKVTAPELAERFEVSRRTIYRDIDDICKAGIPIISVQGGDGGISISDGYKLDKSVLTVDELQNIITGLKSLGSVSDTTRIERLINKLSPKREVVVSIADSIIIDLSSHYKSSLSEKITMLKTAISENKLVSFDYYSEKGQANRTIEPYFLTFKWAAWYVFGYCRDKNDYRLFKLNRLWSHRIIDDTFIPREIPVKELDFDDYFSDDNKITIIFDKSLEYRLIEEYGPECYEVMGDGNLKFSVGYTNKEYILSWILGFGDKARVVEPTDMAEEIKEKAKNIIINYEHDI
ncbi:YafY family transcriptional regulator [Sedimentibacter hydroxybenzoicus DSM 7310]|uniref:YafY family transcriptional regulator n=1 Tax=Sedimentibacter hydroxybenzoicus DSM 7310 TaxID=1123245 RepID=A0A974BMK1_SEDHY|nr:YafY family protein [Sedimentibacter hydroxybenzoicus]NYB75586.1 YafY family transcriptional regulator [Sedimentibacter hydroxybenzoicus DSM 7310]